MGRDALSHTLELCNKILQELNQNGLCQYKKSHKAYIFEQYEQPVNCSHILMFLNMATCYVVTPHIHQWYRINTKEILQDHDLALCDNEVVHIVSLPPVINTYMTTPRVMLQQTQDSRNNARSK